MWSRAMKRARSVCGSSAASEQANRCAAQLSSRGDLRLQIESQLLR
jgi:hypothetical protein